MEIKRLEIYGYGKWIDQTFDLNEGLQVFFGKNETGKSTIMSFIHSILFGFPTRNSTLLRYEPLESSKYGGRILAEDSILGEVIIERVHGKVSGDVTVTLEDGTVGSDELLERVLKGLDRDSFQSIFSFSLSDIEDVHQLDRNKLSRYLLNIGAHSTDYYLELVDEFQKNAYDLYRPSGRIPPLNKKLSKIEAQEKKLEKLERQNESYLDLTQKYKQQDELLKKIEKREQGLQNSLKNLKEFKKEWHVFQEIQLLQNEIKTSQLAVLKEDGPYLLSEYKKKIAQASDSLEDLKAEQLYVRKTLLEPEIIEKYQENKKEIVQLEQELPEMVEEIGYLDKINNEIEEKQKNIDLLKRVLKIEEQEVFPHLFSKEDQLQVKEWQVDYNSYNTKIVAQTSAIQDLDYQIKLNNQKADQYEEMMWEPAYFKEIEKEIHWTQKPESRKEKKSSNILPWAMGFIGLILIIASFVTNIFNPWPIAGGGSLLVLISLFIYQKRKKNEDQDPIESQESEKMLLREYEKQRQIQSEWQLLLGEIDAIQERYQAMHIEKSNQMTEQEHILEYWKRLLRNHHLPESHLLENAEKIMTQTAELNAIEKEIRKLNDDKKKLSEKLEEKLSIVTELLFDDQELDLSEKIHYFRSYLKELNQLLQTEEEKIDRLHALNEKERQLIEERVTHKDKIDDLLEASGAETEDEFLALYKEQEKLEQKRSRVAFLKENVPSFDSDKPLPTKEELVKKEKEINKQLKEQEEKSQELIDQRANTRVAIENLKKDGSYSEALQEFENQKTGIQHLVDEWISDKLAATIIQSTLNQVTKDRFEDIIAKVNEYFRMLTDGEYRKILFKEDELFVQNKEGTVVEVKTLSRGTAEPLYVAIRLAYIVQMQDIIKLPIMMDDPFVNFDQKRKQNVYRLLDRLSDTLQIIFFSFDRELTDTFHQKQIIELEEITKS